LIFVAASAIVPIFANALRIVGIILVGYLLGSTESAAMHHTLTGSVFTGLIMLLMLLLGRLWREEPATPPATPLPSLHTDDPRMLRAAMPGTPQYAKSSVVFAILAATSVSIAPLYAQVAWRQTVDAGLPKLAAPALAAPWLAGTSGTRNWLPHVVAPSSEMMQTYLAGNREVTLYIAYFPASQADVKLVSSENALYDSSHWLQISNGFDVATCDGRSFRVRDMILRSAGSSLRMWYWYWIDGTCTGDERMAKFLLAKARLFGSPQGSAIVAVAGSNLDGSPADTATLRHVISGIPIDLLLRVN
jgi:EpsI family protein